MNFDELVELASNMKEIKGEECMICHFPIDENIVNNIMKLSCNHFYHKSCIDNLMKSKEVVCPYCQRSTNINKIKPVKLPKVICTSIIKTGENKGKQCNKLNCKKHIKKIEAIPILCNTMLKTGKNKGTLCKRHDCLFHNKTIIL